MGCRMPAPTTSTPDALTPRERDYIRSELDMFFSTLPSVAEGFHLKAWRGGPQAGQPKVPQAAAGLLGRGLMRLDAATRQPRLFFTDAGLTALHAMMGVVQNLPFLGHTGVRRPPACEGRISTGRVSCAGSGWPPRGQARWG